MKVGLGRCLLDERLLEAGMTREELAGRLLYKPERLADYMENKRVMPLAVALSIAGTVGCAANELYELLPDETSGSLGAGT